MKTTLFLLHLLNLKVHNEPGPRNKMESFLKEFRRELNQAALM